MNFLEQATPLTPKKKRSLGLNSPNISLSSTDFSPKQHHRHSMKSPDTKKRHTPHHLQLDRDDCNTSPNMTPTRLSQSPKLSHESVQQSDRFIPNRNKIDFDFCHHQLFSAAMLVGNEENAQQSISHTPSGNATTIARDLMGRYVNYSPPL